MGGGRLGSSDIRVTKSHSVLAGTGKRYSVANGGLPRGSCKKTSKWEGLLSIRDMGHELVAKGKKNTNMTLEEVLKTF
ncbi:hypothetical protein L2E82_11881 [Cichorium intybus]|uniref:Uncharacterized protein n=1 Tax=Cichorium intybus TaxID=13427 RepID=A0ACB9GE05_CICIN|nr:hypothetical protein L2E82_11881 [Cichorium intybus]